MVSASNQQDYDQQLAAQLKPGKTRLDKLNFQLATGKTVNVPSDNPVKTGSILQLSSTVRQTEQYLRNTDHAISWLEATDTVLRDLTSIIHRCAPWRFRDQRYQ